jgi:hypothetical protein
VVAALFAASEAQMLAQRIEQCGPHIKRQLMSLAIDSHGELEKTIGHGLRGHLRPGAVENIDGHGGDHCCCEEIAATPAMPSLRF